MKRIVFPEINHSYVQEAIKLAKQKFPDFEAIGADNLEHACAAVKAGVADSMIAGIDYTSRDVILAARDIIGVKNPRQLEKPTFSASFIFTKENKATPLGQSVFILGDAAACKHPSFDQLYDITLETHETATKYFKYLNHNSTDSALNSFLTPRIAMLSFSTLGSGGRDETISLSQSVVEKVRETHPEILIDGEMQLDAAINPRVGEKKAPYSPVAGYANILIVPDLNSGNILYKAMEQFGGFTAAGPILQGFNAPISDLSRGSIEEDVLKVIEYMLLLAKH